MNTADQDWDDQHRGKVAPAADALTPEPVVETGERAAAEQEYTAGTFHAFDYTANPVGSRDWTLFWQGWQARAAHAPTTPRAADGGDSAEDRFEHYVQTGIANAPEPLRALGEYLTRVLDEDEFPNAERLLLQLATAPAASAVDAREVTRAASATPDGRDAVDAARWRAMRGHLDLLHVKHCVGYPGSTDDSDGYLSDIDAAADVVVAAMKRGE